jgi:2-dehydro-3-deoxyphosphogluconate aldolase/(4S)-4-hydroxy-2-oxoglutarate aldolase
MENESQMKERVKEIGLLPLFYHDDINICMSVSNALYAAGTECIEFTNRGPKALENFTQLVKLRDEKMRGLILAVGTIKTSKEAQQFIDAGADVLISPVFDKGVCDTAYLNKILWIPGCTTPTEIHVAQQSGCELIKLFPGNVLGPGFVEAIMPLFRGVDFTITGGVEPTAENIGAWFKAGVKVVGMGSKLITKKLIETKDYAMIESDTRKVLEIIRTIKS